MTQVRKVVVAGGGIGGLTTALALRRAGVEVEVHERYDRVQSRATGFTIWSYAIRRLLDLGVDPATLDRLGSAIEVTEIRSRRGRLLEALPVGEVSRRLGAPTYDIDRGGVQAALLEALGDGVVRMGSEVVGVEQDDAGAVLLLAGGGRAEGDVAIAADGAHSVLRAAVAGERALRYSGFSGWSALVDFTHPLLPERHHVEVWEKGSKGGVADVGGGRARWYAMQRAPAGEADAPVDKQAILDHVAGWYEPLPAAIAATPAEAIVRNEAWDLPPLERWVDRRVVLLGDAAHATTPFAGMGACMAIEDGTLLGRLLAEQPHERALAEYESERKRRAEQVVRTGRRMGRLSQLQSSVALRLRDEFLAHVPSPKIEQITLEVASGR